MNIYHITSKREWIDATRSGLYAAESLQGEGFIHCSTAAQVPAVARQYYRGRTDLVLLVIEAEKLDSALRWEQSAPPPGIAASAVFPHVYGPITLEAIKACLDFAPDADGGFSMPPLPPEGESAVR